MNGFDRTHLRSVLGGLFIGALLMAAVPVVAANGDPILLGEKNKAIRSTWVASRGPSVMKIANTLNGTAVELKTAAHVAPMIVHSSTRVDNLNVDLLDGLDSSAFAAAAHDHDSDYLAAGGKAADSDLLDGMDSVALVGPECPFGETVIWYHRSGPVCSKRISAIVVDGGGDLGQFSSAVLDAEGFAVIAYYDLANGDLKLARCPDAACASPTVTTVDSTDDVGSFGSLVLDASGYPVISYHDGTNQDLKVARCSDATCTSPTLTTVDSTDNVGLYTSLALDADGYPVIAYYDNTNEDLKVAHCDDAACTTKTLSTVDGTGIITGKDTSLALDADGYPVIAYYNQSDGDLMLAHCNDADCAGSNETINMIDGSLDVGKYTSLLLDAGGQPVISYYNVTTGDLRLAHCNDPDCAGSDEAINTIDSTNTTGLFTSLVLDVVGNPVISYYDNNLGDLRLARCSDAACSAATLSTIDSTDTVGQYTSLMLDAGGNPVISYHDATNGDLKLVVLVM